MTFLDNVTRGGQTWAHRMRMFKQVVRLIIVGSLFSSLSYFSIKMLQEPKENFQAVYYQLKSKLPLSGPKMKVDAYFWYKITNQRYSNRYVYVNVKDLNRKSQKNINHFYQKGFLELGNAIYVFLGTWCLFLCFFGVRGFLTRKKQHLQGIKLEKPWKVRIKMALCLKKSDLKLGTVSLLKGSETKHMLICGTTGAGKTNALRLLMHQIRKRGDRAIIVDTTGDFTSNFYREDKDILFNPYDVRTKQWHPWCECDQSYDYEYLVNSLIPKNSTQYDDFFTEAGRAVLLSSLMKYKEEGREDIEKLVHDLLRKNADELYHDIKGTDAQIYVDPKGERTTVSIRATIANSIRHFNALKNTSSPFSIRDWILQDKFNEEWLFLACEPSQRKSLNALMSVWFSIAMNAIKQRSLSQAKQTIWLIIDELHSLQKLEYLEESLAELRKYGGSIVLATQNISQLDKIYGHHGARVILDQCGTKVSFRQSDAEIAKRMSALFGQNEFREMQEGVSYGAHEMRDGVNLSNIEKSKSTISPTQILNLPDLEAFIKLPGNWPALKSKFKYHK